MANEDVDGLAVVHRTRSRVRSVHSEDGSGRPTVRLRSRRDVGDVGSLGVVWGERVPHGEQPEVDGERPELVAFVERKLDGARHGHGAASNRAQHLLCFARQSRWSRWHAVTSLHSCKLCVVVLGSTVQLCARDGQRGGVLRPVTGLALRHADCRPGGFSADVGVVLHENPNLVLRRTTIPASEHERCDPSRRHVHRSFFVATTSAERKQIREGLNVTVDGPTAQEVGNADEHVAVCVLALVPAEKHSAAVDGRSAGVDHADGCRGVGDDGVGPVVREQQRASLNAVAVEVQHWEDVAVEPRVDRGKLVARRQVSVDVDACVKDAVFHRSRHGRCVVPDLTQADVRHCNRLAKGANDVLVFFAHELAHAD